MHGDFLHFGTCNQEVAVADSATHQQNICAMFDAHSMNVLRPSLINSSSAVYYSTILPLVGKWGSLFISVAIGLLTIRMIVLNWRKIWKCAVTTLLVLSPFFWLTVGQSLWMVGHQTHELPDLAMAEQTNALTIADTFPQGGARRILWIIFDEMDQRLTFEERPRDIRLPEFDRLRRTAIEAIVATPPAGNTLASIPSLLSGRAVMSAQPVDSSELMLQYGDGKQARWGEKPNIFYEAQLRGYNTALVGWYHPYNRVLGKNLDASQTYAGTGDHAKFSLGGIWRNMKSEWLSLVPAINRQTFIDNMQAMQDKTIQLAASREYEFVFSHLPGLHTPYIYDRHNARYTLFRDQVTGYFDHMVLADKTMGRIRAAMEQNETWDETLVIVSSDHWWRSSAIMMGKSIIGYHLSSKCRGKRTELSMKSQFRR